MHSWKYLYGCSASSTAPLSNSHPTTGSLMQGNAGSETDTSCVLDPDLSRTVISLQMCGNGIVEAGEDCDPGAGSNSTCCDAKTCKFTTNSVCDPSSTSCCTSGCQFSPSTQVCRPAKNPTCDIAEYCTGTTAACPRDVTTANGQPDFLRALALSDTVFL